MLEHPGVQVRARPRQRVDDAVLGAAEPALAVDHHRRRQHQPLAARGEHLREQHRRRVVVVAAVGRRIGGVHPGAHHRRLVAHHVDAVEQRSDRTGVPDVDPLHTLRWLGAVAVRGGQHRVDGDDVVARVGERGRHPRSDEAGRAGQQDSHGRSNGNSTPSCGRQWVHSRSLGDLVDRLVHQLLERHQVALELGEHVDGPHARPGLDAGIDIGHQSDCRVTHLQLTRQHRLGIARHVHQREALPREPLALGTRREPRALDHHHGAAVDRLRAGR